MSVYFFKCTFSIKVQKIKSVCIFKVIFSWDTSNLNSSDEGFSVGVKIASNVFSIFTSYFQHIYLSCLFITVHSICMKWDFTAVFPLNLCGLHSDLIPSPKPTSIDLFSFPPISAPSSSFSQCKGSIPVY